jgi:hypothetical protein
MDSQATPTLPSYLTDARMDGRTKRRNKVPLAAGLKFTYTEARSCSVPYTMGLSQPPPVRTNKNEDDKKKQTQKQQTSSPLDNHADCHELSEPE